MAPPLLASKIITIIYQVSTHANQIAIFETCSSFMFLKVKECRRVLFQEILKAPYSSQAVNGVYMYPNTQCKNENQGQGVSKDY